MKAVLLARGLGSRMKQEGDARRSRAGQAAAAAAGAKGHDADRRPVDFAQGRRADETILDYVLSALADAGCSSVCFVVAPDQSAIRDYYDGPRTSVAAHRSTTPSNRSLTARRAPCRARESYAGRSPFLVLNSDNLYPSPVLARAGRISTVRACRHTKLDSLIRDSGFPRDRVIGFAAIETDGRRPSDTHRREARPASITTR